jgi:hypothetical protein
MLWSGSFPKNERASEATVEPVEPVELWKVSTAFPPIVGE